MADPNPKDPAANDGNIAENKEVLNEKDSDERAKALNDKNEKAFRGTQTFENLQNALPTKIKIRENEVPINGGKRLLERISSNKAAYESNWQKLETAFFHHGKDFFSGIELSSIQASPTQNKEVYMQKLAIIEACHSDIINLKPEHRTELVNLLVPLASRSKVGVVDSQKEDIKEVDKMSEEELAFTKSPAFPVLTRLLNEWLISHVDFEEIKEYYIENKNFTWINLKDHPQTVQKHLDSVFNNGPENQKKNIAHFFEDFPEWSEEDMQYRPALRMIAENYISITGKNSSKNIQLDYFTAVEVSANLVLEKYQNIDTLSVKYEEAMKFVKNWKDLAERYQGLKMLIELAWEHEWQFASLEKQNQRTRVEQLLIASHQQGQQEVENRIEEAKQARKLGEEENKKELEEIGEADKSVDTGIKALPWGEIEREVMKETDRGDV